MFMGKVVDIETTSRRKRGKGRKRPSKTALVLGGGGFTGGVYEIGALRALDLLAVNSTVNNFDVYVGTSAGSFVATMLANGVTPDEMMQVINDREPSELDDLDLDKVLRFNYLGFLQKAAALPLRTAELLRRLVRIGDFSAIDIVVGLAEALPTGLYSGAGIADYVEQALADLSHTLPSGLRVTKVYDLAEFVAEAISSVRDAVVIGGLLAVVILFLFLRDWRVTAVAATTVVNRNDSARSGGRHLRVTV